jgi:hypothetical protein
MRFIMASMPLLALAAIFSSSAIRHIDTAAHSQASMNDKALPECVLILQHARFTKHKPLSRPKKEQIDWDRRF